MKLKLGMHLKDKISGFEGVATGRTEWLYGCIRWGLSPSNLTKEGALQSLEWFDEPQLEVVKKAFKHKKPTTGGPQTAPQRAKDPVR